MKIILLSPAHPLRGGIAASSERLATALQFEGHEVLIYSFSLQYPSILFPGKTQFTEDPAPSDLRIESRINSVNPVNWIHTGLSLRRMKPDLIISRYWLPFMGPCLGTIQLLARGNGHTKVLCIADNIIPHEARPGDRLFTRYFCQHTDAFIAMSRSVLEELKQFSKRPARYIPHPIYDTYGPKASRHEACSFLQLDEENRYLLFFGFIRDYKGLDLLLEAMADDRIRQTPIRLIIAGEFYGNEDPYKALIQKLDLQDRLILHTDYIPTEEVRYYFGAADLVVQPYKTATQSGISQMAYHFDKPMIVTEVGGLPEIVPHGKAGYVVPVDAGAIASAILDFFQHDRKSDLERGVQEEKKRFSWENMVDGITRLYQEICD